MARHTEVLTAVESPGRPDTRYQDGDTMIVVNGRYIRCFHAMQICDHRKFGLNQYGLRDRGTLAEEWFRRTYRYVFERIGIKEVRRTQLSDRQVDVFSDVKDANGRRIYVEQHIAWLTKSPEHFVFGSPGAEVWYGGELDLSDAALDGVWNEIEQRTDKIESDHEEFPFTAHQLRTGLVLAIDDQTDAVADEWMSSELDGPIGEPGTKMVRKRKHRIRYETLGLPVPLPDIRNKRKRIDVRRELQLRPVVVESKNALR